MNNSRTTRSLRGSPPQRHRISIRVSQHTRLSRPTWPRNHSLNPNSTTNESKTRNRAPEKHSSSTALPRPTKSASDSQGLATRPGRASSQLDSARRVFAAGKSLPERRLISRPLRAAPLHDRRPQLPPARPSRVPIWPHAMPRGLAGRETTSPSPAGSEVLGRALLSHREDYSPADGALRQLGVLCHPPVPGPVVGRAPVTSAPSKAEGEK